MAIEIGIIGGTGGMGKWFADFLSREGYAVHVTGRSRGLSLAELTGCCQVIIISVPIRVTFDVISAVGPLLREDSLLMDLTSLKAKPVQAMLGATRAEVIGCHPLFGPSVTTMAGQNIVLCPARGEKWLDWWRSLLVKNGACVVEKTPVEHDKQMAIIQGLNHVNTLVMGLVMAKNGFSLANLKEVTTPLFCSKAAIMERFFSNNPGLYSDILTQNPHLDDILTNYEETLKEITSLIRERKAGSLEELLSHYGGLLLYH